MWQALIDVDDPHVEAHFPDDKQGDWLFPDQNHNNFVSPEQGKVVADLDYQVSLSLVLGSIFITHVNVINGKKGIQVYACDSFDNPLSFEEDTSFWEEYF